MISQGTVFDLYNQVAPVVQEVADRSIDSNKSFSGKKNPTYKHLISKYKNPSLVNVLHVDDKQHSQESPCFRECIKFLVIKRPEGL